MPILNEKAQTTAAAVPALAPQFDQFDLSNPQHLAMRKLMADVYARHANALEMDLPLSARTYQGMGLGLERVARTVLNDATLSTIGFSLYSAMHNLENAYSERPAA
ncbi:hypothetical protein V8687_18385 [Shewanella baltica]|uniref:hypothetical protein n=1 Tax=Shewanella baltica TaxID=62322 RepID=UPI0030CC1E5D